MLTLPIIDVQLNPLDGLLATLGARLYYLAKHTSSEHEKFTDLIKDKQATLQFTSNDSVARHYCFKQGMITHQLGVAENADLTIHFKNSLTGAKLLAKADTAILMQAIQDGDMTVTGDYKLIFWFAQVVKYAVKIPETYQTHLDNAKPYIKMARPYISQVGQLAQKVLNHFKK